MDSFRTICHYEISQSQFLNRFLHELIKCFFGVSILVFGGRGSSGSTGFKRLLEFCVYTQWAISGLNGNLMVNGSRFMVHASRLITHYSLLGVWTGAGSIAQPLPTISTAQPPPTPRTHHQYRPAAPHHHGIYGVAALDPTLALMYRLRGGRRITRYHNVSIAIPSLQSTRIYIRSLPWRSRGCSLFRCGIDHTHFSKLCVGHCVFCLGVASSFF